jgi:hypothetical protein
MRKLIVAFLVVLVLAPAGLAAAAQRITDRGIVLRVRINGLMLRELDGSQRNFRISGSTVVTLDGHPATILDLQRGDIAFVDHFGKQPAFRVRAFTR